MIISGNKDFGLAGALYKIYPDAKYCSTATGFDLGSRDDQERFAFLCLEHDVIINCAALFKFHQTNLLEVVWKTCMDNDHYPHIINIGSTTDRVKKGTSWRYNAEKKALRDYSNSLGLLGVWDKNPKITYVSLGTMDNNAHKFEDRKTLYLDEAANYIKWIIDQPKQISINEISIDPMQNDRWYI